MKRLSIVLICLLTACGTPQVETAKLTCNPPKQTKDIEEHLGLFTSVQDYEEAKAFKQRDFENCIKGVTMIREFQAQDLLYRKMKKELKLSKGEKNG